LVQGAPEVLIWRPLAGSHANPLAITAKNESATALHITVLFSCNSIVKWKQGNVIQLQSLSAETETETGSVTIKTGMVENVRKAIGISAICHSIPEIYSTSGLVSAILNFASRPTSGSVGGITISSGMVENVRKAIGISAICHSIPEIYSTSGLVSAILNSGSRPSACSVRH
jgi:hypothetical protein